MPEVIATNVAQQHEVSEPDFGEGRYSPLMREVYRDSLVIFKLPNDKAEKLARRCGTELGAIMQNTPVEVKIGKANKDGRVTISEAAKLKGVALTNTIFALKALNYAAEAGKNGFSWGNTHWSPCKSLVDFFATL